MTSLALAVVGVAIAVLPVPGAQAAGKAGPQVKKCAKLKKKALKQRCLSQNRANRVAFNQIKDSSFVGRRGDGQYVDHYFCANGRFESRITSTSTGTGVSEGTRWWISGAVVRQGGTWVNAFLGAPGGFEIALQRRGSQWRIAVSSLDRMLYPGDVAKARAIEDCAA